MKPPVVIRIFQDDKLVDVKQFSEFDQILFGQNEEVHVHLQGQGVSPLHAVIEERDTGFYISDLGSQGGTFKNGQKILDERIESGDEIKVGPFKVQFFVGAPKPVKPPGPASEVKQPVTEAPIEEEAPVVQGAAPEKSEPEAVEEETQEAPPETTNVSELPKREKKVIRATSSGKISEDAQEIEIPKNWDDKTEDIVEPPPLSQVEERTSAKTQANASEPQKPEASGAPAKGTYAPPSDIKDLKDVLKPEKGTTVEVVVAWRERILGTYHFNEKGYVTIGSDPKCDIALPLVGARKTKHTFLEIGSGAKVCITPDMTGELIKDGKVTPLSDLARNHSLEKVPSGYAMLLEQGAMIRVGLQDDVVSIYVRYVPESAKPIVGPFLDFTASEVTGVILAVVVTLMLALYMSVFSPSSLDDEARVEEPLRKAVITFKPPAPVPKKIEQVQEKPKEKKIVKIVDKKQKTTTPSAPKKDPGKAGGVKPVPNKKPTNKLVSAKPGGAVKTGKKAAAAPSKKKDVNKMGILGVFGSKGAQNKLDQVSSGAGELTGEADRATGYAGFDSDRQGDSFGTKLKDTGGGGRGEQTIGIAGVGTKGGKGTGSYGAGSGGIGQKGKVEINVGGQEAEFLGSIDKEAIRKVILHHKRQIQACYERALNRNPDLYGKLVLEWDIEDQGRVGRTVVKENNVGSKAVADCIVRRLKSWKFPAPPPQTIGRVTYPFVFTSQ